MNMGRKCKDCLRIFDGGCPYWYWERPDAEDCKYFKELEKKRSDEK